MIRIFDTHAHLNLEPFKPDDVRQLAETNIFPEIVASDAVTRRNFGEEPLKIEGILLPGIDAASSEQVIKLTELSPVLLAAVGIQPNSVAEIQPSDWEKIESLAGHPKVVAVGEVGLDRYWQTTPFDDQIAAFERQLELAQRLAKPILIHCRDAWSDLIPILRRYAPITGLMHAFSGTPENAGDALDLGLHISFAGAVTYRNEKFSSLWAAAKTVPIDRLLVETDAPYMTPHPFRGKLKSNVPIMTAWVIHRLSELRNESIQWISETTTQNAKKLLRTESQS